MATQEPLTVFSPLPPRNSTCGYCGPPGQRSEAPTNYHAAEGVAEVISCRVYQEMMDRGWRRSGTYFYRPDLKRSCCPQYTIRLDALQFAPSKSQRKVVNKFNRFIMHGDQKDQDTPVNGSDGTSKKGKSKGKGKEEHKFKLTDDIRAVESMVLGEQNAAHKYEVVLEQSSFTTEKFALYESYQKNIHNDDDITARGFTRFLCKSPLVLQVIDYPSGRPAGLPQFYGSYHQLHKVDGKLVAMSVLDITPNCVSSVYFMYEKEWEKFTLGKLSAMREVSLVKEMHAAGLTNMKFLYLGLYVHTCMKMRYKGEYSPTYMMDPEEYEWFPLEKFRPLLDKNHYVSFAHQEHCLTAPATEAEPPREVAVEVLSSARTIVGFQRNIVTVEPLSEADQWTSNGDQSRKVILRTLNALGNKVTSEILWHFGYDISR
ncbi:arginine-tRNA-protein transferase [Ganoderma leucocontextum]|nr:arginine-tRNA-protein transferase [Ganoderma leucocontextum]